MNFSLSLPGETLFGWGRLIELPLLVSRFGTKIALVHGGESFDASGLRERVYSLLGAAGITLIDLPAQRREPEPEDVDIAAKAASAAGAQAVIAIGGGSVLDLGKAAAAMAAQTPVYSVRAYLEGVGEGRKIEADPLPFIAIPTTSGTGSEATKNSVISSHCEGFKKSLRDRRMLADIALIDPELTVGLPPCITASTGLDAITQLIESYTSNKSQPLTDALALRGLKASRALPIAFRDGYNREARERMTFASYLSGVCLANSGLGAAHGIAAALGTAASIGHGLACAMALPWVMAVNIQAVSMRYAHVAQELTGEHFHDEETAAKEAIRHIWNLLKTLEIPRASDLPEVAKALQEDRLPALAVTCHGNSLNGNPVALSDDDLVGILRAMRDGKSPIS